MRITCFCLFICLVYPFVESSIIDCDYGHFNFHAVGSKYRCFVSNNLNISSPESAQIDAVKGDHMSGESNNHEIYFYAHNEHIEYFPRRLEKIFTNLTGIIIIGSQLKEIHQDDLKPYLKLKYLRLAINHIEILDDGLFNYQPDIEVIMFDTCKIFHISPAVFDNLPKLTTLYLKGNKCTNKYSKNNRADTLEVIKSVKSTCISSNFSKLDEKMKNLEDDYIKLNPENFTNFKKSVKDYENDLEKSKFSKFQKLRERVVRIWKQLELSDIIENRIITIIKDELRTELNHKIDRIEHSLSERMKTQNNTSKIQHPWIIIATAVVGFTQTIILAVIFKQIFA